MMEEIYKENILDHYRNPRNKIVITATHQHTEKNPLCGDEITIYLDIQDNQITAISFQGTGCAISQASVSILTEHIHNKTINEALELQPQHIKELLGIPISYTREKCAMLSLKTLQGAINVRNN